MRIEYIENGFFIKDGESCLVANIFTDKPEDEIKAIAERTLENCIAEKEKAQVKSLDECKEEKIALSKLMLSEWLANNPMLYSDGNYYSVTEEKQSLLNSNLASYGGRYTLSPQMEQHGGRMHRMGVRRPYCTLSEHCRLCCAQSIYPAGA